MNFKRIAGVLLGFTTFVGVCGVTGVGGLIWYFGREVQEFDRTKFLAYRPPQITRIYDRSGETLIGEIYSERRTFVALENIPLLVRNAFLAAEDADFYNHHGLDHIGILRAFVENIRAGKLKQGASTITQQVVKNFLLSPERSLRRKVHELILARKLEDEIGKDLILELYLNEIYLGHGAYGVEEAARLYFGKGIAQLDLEQAALLAALPKAPGAATPHNNPERALARRNYVLRQMVDKGFIKEADIEAPLRSELKVIAVQEAREVDHEAEEIVDIVRKQLRDHYGEDRLNRLGAKVITTADLQLQIATRVGLVQGLHDLDGRHGYGAGSTKASEKRKTAAATLDLSTVKAGHAFEAVVVDQASPIESGGLTFVARAGETNILVTLPRSGRYGASVEEVATRFPVGSLVSLQLTADTENKLPAGWQAAHLVGGPQAAVVLADVENGEVLAMVGGESYRRGALNRAMQSRRQPGSSFKPFVYGAAIESKRFTAATMVDDSPDIYEKWRPTNYEVDVYRGPIRLRQALTHSVNTIAIKLANDVGPATVIDFAHRAGVESKLPENLSIALGTGEVTPFELMRGYMTIARGGERIEPVFILRVEQSDDVSWAPPAAVERAFDSGVAFVLSSMMQSVVQEGTGVGAKKLGIPLAGKTGTAAEAKDAWFAGFSKRHVAVAWVGFDMPKPLGRKETGGRAALPIWSAAVEAASVNREPQAFIAPSDVVARLIDTQTGLLVAPEIGEGNARPSLLEYFISGTEPKDYAPQTENAQDVALDLYGDGEEGQGTDVADPQADDLPDLR